ncbi:hypothetical protein [Antarcticimicrobium luteum]|uniref:Sulfotransferase family protein n=1 Tax=Antarcticimicrobium luteum TaxID=2547397 RepID=A0A4R5VF99_9RHOB|nr:hypothetical protein [Antarcticimicrobium luteum]TDK50908.1 hypothetical protein E1832_05025 [Antarcticimicrobium luteum]
MFSTLYLHIGQEKTGTTSIQSFLHANRDALRDAGIFTPRSLGRENHKALAAYAFDEGSGDISVTSVRAPHKSGSVEAYRAGVAAALSREVSDSAAQVGVISSEDLSRLYTAREVGRVVDLLRPFCKELRIIVLTRRQDLMASSRYYSFVLGGSQAVQILPTVDQLTTPPYYDYAHNIGLWADAVGDANVILRRFPERPSRAGFNSVRTFCGILGLDAAAYQMVQRQHVSLDAVNQIILQNYNALTQNPDPAGIERLKDQLVLQNDSTLRYISSRAQAERFYAHFHADNQALFRRLKAEDEAFSLDFSMYPKENMRTRFQRQAIQRLLALLTRSDAETET